MKESINQVRTDGYIKLESRDAAIKLVMDASWEGYRFGYKKDGDFYIVVLL